MGGFGGFGGGGFGLSRGGEDDQFGWGTRERRWSGGFSLGKGWFRLVNVGSLVWKRVRDDLWSARLNEGQLSSTLKISGHHFFCCFAEHEIVSLSNKVTK